MSFPLGKPVLVMLVVAVVGGIAAGVWPTERSSVDVRAWTFADSHQRSYDLALPAYRAAHPGVSVDVELVAYNALNVRLSSMFMSGYRGADAPDLSEIEIGAVGQYFRPPLREIGFLPLNDFLETRGAREIATTDAPGERGWHARLAGTTDVYTHDGARWTRDPARAKPDTWIDRIVAARTAPWSKEGRIFGVPHDVHPVVLAYRHDLFTEAGIDLPTEAATWLAFHEACLKFQSYWTGKGFPYRHAVELTEAKADQLLILLNQQGINPVDDRGVIHLTDPKVARTVTFYAQMVAGRRRVAGESPSGTAPFVQDLIGGYICAYLMADWRLTDLRKHGGEVMAGRMRVMPLPVFSPTDAPTATWGGTMMGILKSCPDPERAWTVLEHLYFDPHALAARLAESDILPPVRDVWGQPHYHQPDPFFGGQKVYEVLIDLADKIPVRYMSPATALANQYLAAVVTRAVQHCARHGDADGLEPLVAAWLADAAIDLRRRIDHMRME